MEGIADREGVVFGQEPSLARLTGFLEGAEGGPGACVITGDRGSGKTAVYEWAARRARALGVRVLVLRPCAVESELAFGGVADLLRCLSDALGAMSGAQQGVVDRVLLRGEAYSGESVDERDLCVAVLATVRHAAAAGRVLVAVDGWEWLDAPSQRVLIWVLRRLDGAPVEMLATAVTDVKELFPPRLGDMEVERLSLAPLSEDAIGMLLHQRFGAGVDRVTRRRIAQAAEGNAWAALELASVVVRVEGQPWPVDRPLLVPANVRARIAEQLAGLVESDRCVLAAAFVVGPAPEGVLRRTLVRLGWSASGIEALRARGLLSLQNGSLALCRPLVGAALYVDCSDEARRCLHAALADEYCDSNDHAWHSALAAGGPDDVIADALERAGSDVRQRGDAMQAAKFSEMAWRMTPREDQPRMDERMMALSLDRYRLGDADRARAQWRELAMSSASASSAASALAHLGLFHEGLTVFENDEILRRALTRGEVDQAVRAHAQVTRAVMASWGGRPVAAQQLAESAVRLARGAGAGVIEGEALAALAEASFLLGRGVRRDLLDRAIELERDGPESPVEVRPSFLGALFEVWMSDRLELAEQGLRRALELALRIGDEASPALVLVGLTEVACWQGDLPRAGHYAREASVYQQKGSAWHLQGLVGYAAALAYITAGESDLGRAAAQSALAFDEPRGILLQYGRSSAALGQLELSLGNAEGALGWLEPLHSALRSGGYGEPALFRYLPDLIEARAAVGDLVSARTALVPLEICAGGPGRPWVTAAAARSRGILLVAEGETLDAVAPLQDACTLHEALGQPGEHARSLLALGSAQRRLRRKRDADHTLAKAETEFTRVGMRLWAERTGSERRRTNLRPRADSSLTATEHQIAQLAAEGLSNREIATRVFLSFKTVEATLTRVYRKLGVRSRAALAHRLASHPDPRP